MKHAMRLGTLALAAMVLVAGSASADSKKDAEKAAKKEKRKAKLGLIAQCGVVDPTDLRAMGAYGACEASYWDSYYEARREERFPDAARPDVRTPEEEEKLRQAGVRRLQMVEEAADRWWLELEQAKLEAKSPSPQYPRLAWLNGIWCSTGYSSTHTQQVRWQVVGPNALRRAKFNDFVGADTPFAETSFAVEKVIEDIYYLWDSNEGAFAVTKGAMSYLTEIRKVSDDKHHVTLVSQWLWKGKVKQKRYGTSTFNRCIGRGSTRWPQSKTSADEPARHDQPSGGLPAAPEVSVQTPTPASDCGTPAQCTDKGLRYRNGFGVSQDSALALSLLRKGCDGGDETGCTNLGFMYEKGWHGIPQDLAHAREIYRQECDRGHESCCDRLKKLN